jgi:hypothetical protein
MKTGQRLRAPKMKQAGDEVLEQRIGAGWNLPEGLALNAQSGL